MAARTMDIQCNEDLRMEDNVSGRIATRVSMASDGPKHGAVPCKPLSKQRSQRIDRQVKLAVKEPIPFEISFALFVCFSYLLSR
jgi:hypothetical protein